MRKIYRNLIIIINILMFFIIIPSNYCYAKETTIREFIASNNVSSLFKFIAVNPERVELDKENIQMETQKTAIIIATVKPDNATNKTVTWSSSNSNVATVDNNGNVKAISAGTADIIATTINGKIAKCNVTVKNPVIEVTEVKLNKSELKLEKNKGEKLTATVEPQNATNKTVTWSSSNSNVATVDNNGNIKAISEGTAEITITTVNGKKSKCKVTVNNPVIEVTGINLNKTSMKVVLEDIKTIQLVANITPSNVSETSKQVTWISSDNSIATVNNQGIVTFKNKGTVTIQAKTINNKTAICKIVVEKYGNETNSSDFLSIAKTLHDYVKKNKYYYPTKANVAAGKAVQDYAPTILGYKVDFKYPVFGESSKKRYVDCSSYVSWVIGAYTGTPIKKKSAALLKNPMNFIKVSINSKNKNKSLKAGDVIVKNGHTEIYAGSGMSYSCGSTGQIRATKSGTMGDWKYAFRAPKSLEFRLKNLELVNAKDKCVTGETIQITAKFNGKVYSSKTVAKMTESKVPVLKIRFENGEIRTISNNSNNVKISSDGKEITYTYKITSKDKGALELVSYSGTVYNVAGVSKNIENPILSGKLTIANESATTEYSKVKTEEAEVKKEKVVSNKKINKTLKSSDFKKVVAVTPKDNSCRVAESFCITEKYYVCALINHANNKTIIQVYDKNNGKLVNTIKDNFYHANGMTYNSKNQKIYIAHMNGTKYSIFSGNNIGTTKKISKTTKNLSKSLSGIAYDEYTQNYYVVKGNKLYVYDKNLKYVKTINKSICHTSQDIGAYRGLILALDYNKGENAIDIYRASTGKYLGRYKVDIDAEIESISYDETNKNFALYFNKGKNNAIYTTNSINLEDYYI